MTKETEKTLVRHQKAVFYRNDVVMEETPTPFHDFYTRMFIEDTSNDILPVGGRSREKDFRIEMLSSNPNAKKLIIDAISTRQHSYPEDLPHSVWEFFRHCASSVCAFDTATYEIAYLAEPQSNKLVAFELFHIPEDQLLSKSGQRFQVVSATASERLRVATQILLPEESLLAFRAPEAYCEGLKKMRCGLSRLSKMTLTGLVPETLRTNGHYDFKVHERAMKLALVDIVRPIGWTARGSYNDCVLSFYRIQLQIRFQRFIIALRDAILSTLNEGIDRAGRRIGFKAELAIRGLPTMEATENALDALTSGDRAFTEIMEPFDGH